MKCFYSGNDAVGLCKACGRGLSLAHLTELPRGLACKGRCEEKTGDLIEAEDGNIQLRKSGMMKTMAKGSARATFVVACFFLLFGGILCFIYWHSRDFVSLAFGVALFAFGVFYIFRSRKLGAQIESAKF
ncbi:hypothetical protein SAMN05444156_1600 [Verrucomicrobium sp. GAS474]|uniref:hypothetical protein n=1 Tax=Verrucomicrobium sp. GAS474 TaxID=1882831 RepID=UPI00087CA8B9|nr:hypothetical protein [Verrucomicrobium sp. GAS474]SDU03871.1 hypothetical protein SAMN05444156_1600 [Verrucomicrobium sp. GAS474]